MTPAQRTAGESGRSLVERPAIRNLAAIRMLAGSSAPVLLAAAGFLLGLVHLFRQLGCAIPDRLGLWVNSDTLWMANLFTDIFRDGYSLAGWMFSIAPFWIPDLVLVGIFWFLTGNVISATLFAGFVQILLLIGALHLCRKALAIDASCLQNTSLLFTGTLLALYVAARPDRLYPAFYQWFVPQTHVGSLCVVLCALGLALLWVRRRFESAVASPSLILAYVLVCFLGGMSNLLFLLHFMLPLTVALWSAEFLRLLSLRVCYPPVVFGWFFALLGALANRLLLHAADLSVQTGMSLARARTALDVFLRGAVDKVTKLDGLHVIALLWFLACATYILFGLRGSGRLDRDNFATRILAWVSSIFCLLSSLFGILAMVVTGSNGLADFKDYAWTMHYWHPAFLLPVFGLPLLVVWGIAATCGPRVRRGVALAVALLSVLLPACAISAGPSPRVQVQSFCPPLVHFMDELAVQQPLRYGYGGYWQARLITLFSQRGLRAYAVDGSLNPLLWVNNRQWYSESLEDRKKPPAIDFVVLDDPGWKISREAAVRALGEPVREVRFEDTRVLIYSKSGSAR